MFDARSRSHNSDLFTISGGDTSERGNVRIMMKPPSYDEALSSSGEKYFPCSMKLMRIIGGV